MKISLTGGEILLLIIFSMLSWFAIAAASVMFAQSGNYWYAIIVWGSLPTSMLMTIVLIAAIMRNIE